MCVRKRMSPFHENFPSGPFPRCPRCGNFFIALSSCAEFYFYLIFWGALKLHFKFLLSILLLLMMRQINQSATNQAMNKLKQIEQCVSYKTNEAMCSKLNRSYNM